MKDKLIPIMSVVIGLLAFFLTYKYLKIGQDKLAEQWTQLENAMQKIEVVIALEDIPGGTTISKKDIGRKYFYKTAVSKEAVTPQDAPRILGKKTMYQINIGDIVSWDLIEGGSPAQKNLSSMITPGMRAISIPVGGASAVSGMVRPNDRVDVLGTFTFPSKTVPGQMEMTTLTILQDVTIMATGQKTADQALFGSRNTGSDNYSLVTIEVTPREAELLVFAQQTQGRLTLSLRNAMDVHYEQDLPSINFEHLQNKLPEYNLYRQRNIRLKRNIK